MCAFKRIWYYTKLRSYVVLFLPSPPCLPCLFYLLLWAATWYSSGSHAACTTRAGARYTVPLQKTVFNSIENCYRWLLKCGGNEGRGCDRHSDLTVVDTKSAAPIVKPRFPLFVSPFWLGKKCGFYCSADSLTTLLPDVTSSPSCTAHCQHK